MKILFQFLLPGILLLLLGLAISAVEAGTGKTWIRDCGGGQQVQIVRNVTRSQFVGWKFTDAAGRSVVSTRLCDYTEIK